MPKGMGGSSNAFEKLAKATAKTEEKNANENPKSNNNTKIIPSNEFNPNPEPIIVSNPIVESNNNTESEYNPNHNPTSNPNYEKVKYTDSRTQRAFYYDKKLIKIFDKNYPASKFNKSEIMNDLLRKFLEENKLI